MDLNENWLAYHMFSDAASISGEGSILARRIIGSTATGKTIHFSHINGNKVFFDVDDKRIVSVPIIFLDNMSNL